MWLLERVVTCGYKYIIIEELSVTYIIDYGEIRKMLWPVQRRRGQKKGPEVD